MTEGSDTVLHKGPCPKCGSQDNLVTYTDGHAHCFTPGCGYHPKGKAVATTSTEPKVTQGNLLKLPDVRLERAADGLEKRRLKLATLTRYGYFVDKYSGKYVEVAPYHSMAGEVVLQKLRFPDKSFVVLKSDNAPHITECQLFGRSVYGDRYDRRVVITEGEIDAMSVAQVLDFKAAVVSVNGGAQSAAKCLKANYLWVDRFDEIVLWFDDDAPGALATEECAKLFKVGKVRIAKAGNGHKDASDLLQANLPGDIEAAIYKAQAWRPKGIVNAADNPDDVLAPKDGENAWRYDWPWEMLTAKTGPMLPGQVVYHVSGTGVGKTTAIAEIMLHLMDQPECKIGAMFFEDTRRDVKLRLLGLWAKHRLDLDPLPDAEMAALHGELFGKRAIELFDPETAQWEVEAILGYVRYLAKALDCKVIFMDPLSYIVAGMPIDADERRALDRVSRDLAMLAKELGICVHISHHLSRPEGNVGHEDGAPISLKEVRGSGGIAAFATVMVGHERNQQAGEEAFLITQLRLLKNRPRSITGVVGCLKYNLATGRLTPTNEKFPGPRSSSGRGQAREQDAPSFAPVTEY